MPRKYILSVEKSKKQFINEYKKIKPKNAREYNAKRGKGIPGWATTAKLIGVKKWSELLLVCDLTAQRQNGVTSVKSIIDLEQKLKELES